jgi:hypothetical protein
VKIEDHIEKFKRFDALRERFSPLTEFELWYWMGLSGGTAIINAALHAVGLTKEHPSFATQVPDVYVEMQPDGGWSHHLRSEVDLIHVGVPPIAALLPDPIDRIYAAMERFEAHRDPCVRGRHAITPEIIVECDQAYDVVVELAQVVLGRAGLGPK